MSAPNEVLKSLGLPTMFPMIGGHLAKVGAFAEHTVVSVNSLIKLEPHLPLVPSAPRRE